MSPPLSLVFASTLQVSGQRSDTILVTAYVYLLQREVKDEDEDAKYEVLQSLPSFSCLCCFFPVCLRERLTYPLHTSVTLLLVIQVRRYAPSLQFLLISHFSIFPSLLITNFHFISFIPHLFSVVIPNKRKVATSISASIPSLHVNSLCCRLHNSILLLRFFFCFFYFIIFFFLKLK